MLKILKRWFVRKPDPKRALSAIPAELWREVEAGLPFLDYLPAALRPRLRALAVEFLAAKEFYGARGFCLTDKIMLTIALEACLPILKRGLAAYRGWVGWWSMPVNLLCRAATWTRTAWCTNTTM